MARYCVQIPNQPPRELSEAHPLLRLGRGRDNDIVLEDLSISRNHARLQWKEGRVLLEDLGSRNGCMVRGVRITAPHLLEVGDAAQVGSVPLALQREVLAEIRVEDAPLPDATVSLLMRMEQLVPGGNGRVETSGPGNSWEMLAILHQVSLDLLQEMALKEMLDHLLGHIYRFLQPGRCAVLLREGEGPLEPVVVHSGQGGEALITLSRTMVEAAVLRREAMLVNHPLLNQKLAQAESLVQSGAVSIITVPLEHEGEVVGLLYLDAGPMRPLFTEGDLTFVGAMGHLAAAKIRHMRMAAEVLKKRDMDKELAMARQIQERLLPGKVPELEGYALYGANTACKQISGDLYGFWPRPDGRLWVVIADVSGKGVGPGLLMATFQAYMHAWSEGDLGSMELAQRISASLAHRTTPNRFITAFLALLDPATGRLESTSAGHNPVLLLRRDGHAGWLEAQGFPLSMFPGTPYGHEVNTLEPGDLLVLVTDGILEATNAEDEEFGLQGLEAVVRQHHHEDLDTVAAAIREALERHTGGAPLQDDRTLVMVRRA